MARHPPGALCPGRPLVSRDDATVPLSRAPHAPRPGGAPDPPEARLRTLSLRLSHVEEARLVPPSLRAAQGDDDRALHDRPPLPTGQDQYFVLLRPRRPGIRGGLRVRRARRLPRPGDGAAGVAGEPLYR